MNDRDREILISEINRIINELPDEKLWRLYIFTHNYA